ncbi:photosynthetic complex assembly protein PuhC [Sphaerotilus mobilis]|uniref:Putative photosynthetic complex assembly protein n=1 Tax=Sphaerotilus mobilis TaxID=47994 RepID=A0A4Q7LV73_9BURK|nr:photosynthetic complex assembly protein PuhC [Sphaerotilus mobilis]RZS58561.1 putative photosynthetic complex assembly protein [Sphaerotilus mobilis]
MSTVESHPLSRAPRLPLLAIGVLLLSAVLGTALVRGAGVSPVQRADAATVRTVNLHFEDRDDGAILIRDADSGAVRGTVAPGTQGFLRSTMRGLVRERRRQGLGPATPFQLLGRADGRLTLFDPGTGRRIDLESFGPTHAAVFAQLITP